MRIVSLKPNITDIVYALGLGDNLVGVTRYCQVPQGKTHPPVVADYTQPYIERIVSLAPDIVLGSKENSSRRSFESLERLKIHTELFSFSTLEETLVSIRAIGKSIGVPDKGNEVAQKMEKELNSLKESWVKNKTVNVIVVWGIRPLVVAGPGSYINDLLNIIAAENVVKKTNIKYPHIGLEELIALNPDVIIDLSMGSEAKTDDNKSDARPWDGIDALKAVQGKKIVSMDAGLFRAGPNLPEALKSLAKKLHNL